MVLNRTFYQKWVVPYKYNLDKLSVDWPSIRDMESLFKTRQEFPEMFEENENYLHQCYNQLKDHMQEFVEISEDMKYRGKMDHLVIHFEEISIENTKHKSALDNWVHRAQATFILGAIVIRNMNDIKHSFHKLKHLKQDSQLTKLMGEKLSILAKNILGQSTEPAEKDIKLKRFLLCLRHIHLVDNPHFHVISPLDASLLESDMANVSFVDTGVSAQKSYMKFYMENESEVLNHLIDFIKNDSNGWSKQWYIKRDINEKMPSFNAENMPRAQTIYIHGGGKSTLKKLFSLFSLNRSPEIIIESMLYHEETSLLMGFTVIFCRKGSKNTPDQSKRVTFKDSKIVIPMEIWEYHLKQVKHTGKDTRQFIMPPLEHSSKWEAKGKKKECRVDFAAQSLDIKSVQILYKKIAQRDHTDDFSITEVNECHPMVGKNLGKYILEQMLLSSKVTNTIISMMYFYTDAWWNINLYKIVTLPNLANVVYLNIYYRSIMPASEDNVMTKQILLPNLESSEIIRSKLDQGIPVIDQRLTSNQFKVAVNTLDDPSLKLLLQANEAILKSFYAGHLDVYRVFSSKAYIYDCNSLYPFIMSSSKFPAGPPYKWNGEPLEKCFGFLRVQVSCSNKHKPILPFKPNLSTSSYYLEGEWEGWYFSEEIKYAQKCGYQVKTILEGYLYKETVEGSYYFKDFMEYFSEARSLSYETFKHQYLSTNDLYFLREDPQIDDFLFSLYLVQKNTSKLMMNSMYGKTAQHKLYSTQRLAQLDLEVLTRKQSAALTTHLTQVNEKYHLQKNLDDSRFTVDDQFFSLKNGSDLKIGAAVTSYARMYIHKTLLLPYDSCALYIDTDCVITTRPIAPKLLHETKIGQFKNVIQSKWQSKLDPSVLNSFQDKDFFAEDIYITGLRNYVYKSKNFKNPTLEPVYTVVSSLGAFNSEESKKIHQMSEIVVKSLYEDNIDEDFNAILTRLDPEHTMYQLIKKELGYTCEFIRQEIRTKTFNSKEDLDIIRLLPSLLVACYQAMGLKEDKIPNQVGMDALQHVYDLGNPYPFRMYTFNHLSPKMRKGMLDSIKSEYKDKAYQFGKYETYPWRLDLEKEKWGTDPDKRNEKEG